MKFATLAILGIIAVAACEKREGDETGRVGASNTVVTSEQNVDTAIITRDTTVDVDTVRHEGDQPVTEDTLKESSGSGSPSADTAQH